MGVEAWVEYLKWNDEEDEDRGKNVWVSDHFGVEGCFSVDLGGFAHNGGARMILILCLIKFEYKLVPCCITNCFVDTAQNPQS